MHQIEFPARFQFLAAMNPCPCGQWGNTQANCRCTPEKINRYLGKLSSPLLDRIDMHLDVQPLPEEALLQSQYGPKDESLRLRERIAALQAHQLNRQGCLNAALGSQQCETLCQLEEAERLFLTRVINQLKLSARGFIAS